MVGGGLIQLVAYGAQDLYKRMYEHEYNIDECMKVTNITGRRTYRNFEIQQISWYTNGNASFTVNKYKELNEKYNNLEFITMNFNDMLDFKIEKGNEMISKKLKEQDKKAKELRERNREIDKKNEKQRKAFDEEIDRENCKKNNRKGPRHHKRFFYGK